MKVTIPKITINPFEAFENAELEKELDRQEKAKESAWNTVYSAIESGRHNVAYWDMCHIEKNGYSSFMRHALHRSTKRDGFLQASCMEIKNRESIPTSDSQHDNFSDFMRRATVPGGINVFIK